MRSRTWLLKTEPSTYSFDQLIADGKTNWNGVRNFQARNFIREMAVGDRALIYHSGDERAVMGIASVVRAAYPDPDPENPGDWVQVDLKPLERLSTPVSLAEIKADPKLKDIPLIRQSRLSVMPLSQDAFDRILSLQNKGEHRAKNRR